LNYLKILLFFFLGVAAVGLYFRWRLKSENLTVTSWWRSVQHNAEVGGVSRSKHLFGWGFDVVPVNDISRAKLKRIGFAKIINEGDHFHVEIA
jgi:uncharacterized protein YcbK (DUF882 family)